MMFIIVVVLLNLWAVESRQLLATRSIGLTSGKVTVCYVSSWAVYRQQGGKFTLDDLDPQLCTHLVYAFAGLDKETSVIKSLDPYNDLEEDYGKGYYKKMTSLKNKYPELSVTLAIGGWNEGSASYSAMAANPTKRKLFVESVVIMLSKHGFDGLDLDWEYPAKRGGSPEDKANFVSLIKDLRAEMDKKGWILTAAIGAGKDTIERAYDLPQISTYLDYIHLMTYDYHGSWDQKVGANAPLSTAEPNDELTVEYSINYLLSNGVAPEKLVMGIPAYGRTFILKNPESKEAKLGDSTQETGFGGPYTKEKGFMGYNEICAELAKDSTWQEWWDNTTKTQFARNGEKVISFDNEISIGEKVKFAMRNKLAGMMVWSVDTDDFRGECHQQEPFTILRVIEKSMATSLQEIEKHKKPNAAVQSISVSLALLFCMLHVLLYCNH
ncbi:probable chitinase 2 isoform X1 [Nilaparvata lugens]|uniref:probable chitinase 2 isoform X1 n=1 Tax=Nilaparvata lugens TaxID=108931 RepID=UPI00193CAC94|nr:probable chitinase 2 isoform X1 [Nilaparvata lugens]